MLTLKEAAAALGLASQKLYYLDRILAPTFVDRGTCMKTRLYDPARVQEYKKTLVELGVPKWRTRIRAPYKRRYRTPEEENHTALSYFWNSLKHGAKKRDLKNKLDFDTFKDIISRNCHYCGEPPESRTLGKYNFKASGVDRVNNDKGYYKNNVVACCKRCNRMKNNMPVSEFFTHLRRILNHSG
jgi:hypothetical protein